MQHTIFECDMRNCNNAEKLEDNLNLPKYWIAMQFQPIGANRGYLSPVKKVLCPTCAEPFRIAPADNVQTSVEKLFDAFQDIITEEVQEALENA